MEIHACELLKKRIMSSVHPGYRNVVINDSLPSHYSFYTHKILKKLY